MSARNEITRDACDRSKAEVARTFTRRRGLQFNLLLRDGQEGESNQIDPVNEESAIEIWWITLCLLDAHFEHQLQGYSGTAVFIKRRTAEAGGEKGTGENGDGSTNKKTKKKKQATLGAFLKKEDADEGEADKAGTDKAEEGTPILGDIDINDLIPTNISTGIGHEEHDSEGRVLSVDFPRFSIANVYTPNSGAKLDRLSYRTDNWDTQFLQYMQDKENKLDVPVIWLGDLNVAHNFRDTWNEGAPHLKKSAGTTAEERESFQEQLDSGFIGTKKRDT